MLVGKHKKRSKTLCKKPDVQVAVIFLPEEYNLDEIHKGIARYNGLRRTSQWKEFEKIVFIHNGKII